MTTAADRGWGPGYPNCQTTKLVTFTSAGCSWKLRAEVKELFAAFVKAFHAEVEPLDKTQCWSFACRAIRGTTSTPSNHSWGLAVDLNSAKHSWGKRGTFTAAQVRAIRNILARPAFKHFKWGGDYTGTTDEMHFEYLGTPSDAAADTRLLTTLVKPATSTTTATANPEVGDVTKDELKTALREVLNEGTGAGQKSWAGTSKAILSGIGNIFNQNNAHQDELKKLIQAGGGSTTISDASGTYTVTLTKQ